MRLTPGSPQPTLVANGDNDMVIPTINSQILADHLPNARLRIPRRRPRVPLPVPKAVRGPRHRVPVRGLRRRLRQARPWPHRPRRAGHAAHQGWCAPPNKPNALVNERRRTDTRRRRTRTTVLLSYYAAVRDWLRPLSVGWVPLDGPSTPRDHGWEMPLLPWSVAIASSRCSTTWSTASANAAARWWYGVRPGSGSRLCWMRPVHGRETGNHGPENRRACSLRRIFRSLGSISS